MASEIPSDGFVILPTSRILEPSKSAPRPDMSPLLARCKAAITLVVTKLAEVPQRKSPQGVPEPQSREFASRLGAKAHLATACNPCAPCLNGWLSSIIRVCAACKTHPISRKSGKTPIPKTLPNTRA